MTKIQINQLQDVAILLIYFLFVEIEFLLS